MIRIETHLADSPLTGQSKWWGEPDMPEELDWPTVMVRDEDGVRTPGQVRVSHLFKLTNKRVSEQSTY